MSLVSVELDDELGVGVVTLADAERRNALTLPMVDEMRAALERCEATPGIGAVVVTGAGSAFCAGADLSDLGGSQEAGLRQIYEGFLRVARCPLPTVAAVNGPAVGAGLNLALACDVRLAARRARFDTRFLDLGLHPGGGHTWMLQRAVGPEAAAAMVLFGQVLSGDDAERRRLVWRCVDDDDLLEEATTVAARAASMPPALARRAKETLRAVGGLHDHGEAVELELEAQVWSLGQPDFAERLAALRRRISGKG